MKSLLTFIFVSTLLVTLRASAEAPLTNLYQARVPLTERSTAAQQAAIRQGLAQVLVKVSGYSGTPDFPGLSEEIFRAEEYLLEFSIESMRLPAAEGVGTQNGEALWVRFNQGLVDELVRQWELPVWPSSRPQIGLTMQVSMAGQNILLSESNYPAAASLLSQNAFRRGVHLQILSSEEGGLLMAGAESDGSSRFDYWGRVELAQDRFGEHLVALSMSSSSGFAPAVYSAEAPGVAEALSEAFDQFVDQLSVDSSFIAAGASGNLVTLELLDIRSFDAYRRAIDSLDSLEMVNEARVLQLDLNRVQVRVELASNIPLLIEAIQQQGVLLIDQESLTQSSLASSATPVLQLRYRGP